jgi:Zn-finger nucleic acid-binding protein
MNDMKCPRCVSSSLDERDRDGMTIDVCRDCRGIWLDRGELEKLVSRAAQDMDNHERGRRHEVADDDDDDDTPGRGRAAEGRQQPARKRRWFESLGELLE